MYAADCNLPPAVRTVIARVREHEPVVHCITAAVSMSLVADGLLAAGTRPLMTETLAEAPHLTTAADALVINLGTLSTDATAAIPATVDAAVAAGNVWVLDPTAIGKAPVRTPMARRLLDWSPTIIRANASEALVLAGVGTSGRGADGTAVPEQARAAAHALADRTGGVVTVTGATDLIVDANRCRSRRRSLHCRSCRSDVDGCGRPARRRESTAPGSFRSALFDALDEVGDES
jgi:hydroxyethylthiazole kinase